MVLVYQLKKNKEKFRASLQSHCFHVTCYSTVGQWDPREMKGLCSPLAGNFPAGPTLDSRPPSLYYSPTVFYTASVLWSRRQPKNWRLPPAPSPLGAVLSVTTSPVSPLSGERALRGPRQVGMGRLWMWGGKCGQEPCFMGALLRSYLNFLIFPKLNL